MRAMGVMPWLTSPAGYVMIMAVKAGDDVVSTMVVRYYLSKPRRLDVLDAVSHVISAKNAGSQIERRDGLGHAGDIRPYPPGWHHGKPPQPIHPPGGHQYGP